MWRLGLGFAVALVTIGMCGTPASAATVRPIHPLAWVFDNQGDTSSMLGTDDGMSTRTHYSFADSYTVGDGPATIQAYTVDIFRSASAALAASAKSRVTTIHVGTDAKKPCATVGRLQAAWCLGGVSYRDTLSYASAVYDNLLFTVVVNSNTNGQDKARMTLAQQAGFTLLKTLIGRARGYHGS